MDRPSEGSKQKYSLIKNSDDQSIDWESSKPYEVKPGLCVIINNMVFTHGKGLPDGKKDEDGLNVLFTTLGFNVKVHQNLTAKEIISTVESYSKMNHEQKVFFLIILSHGTLVENKEAVIGTDGKEVEVRFLQSFFFATKCPSLQNVPKIFMIDACRGGKTENSSSKSIGDSFKTPISTAKSIGVADTADFAIIFASTYGNAAFVTPNKGSYFTQTFVKVTTTVSPETPFTKIIQEVRGRVKTLSKTQTVELMETLTGDYYIKRYTSMTTLQELHKRYRMAAIQWIKVRNITIEEVQKCAERLREHHRNVNISRITGASTSIAGSVIAIVGFGLAPVTFGASIGLSVGGIALAIAGGGTAAGASIADVVIQKSNVQYAQEQLSRDYDELDSIREVAEKINEIIENIREKCPAVSKGELVAIFAEIFVQGASRAGNLGVKLAELAVLGVMEIGVVALRAGGVAAKGIASVAIVLNVVLIPIDLIEIVRSSISLAKGSETKAIEQLNEIAIQLEEQKKAIQEQVQVE